MFNRNMDRTRDDGSNDDYSCSNFQIKHNNLKSQYENERKKCDYLEKEYKKLKYMVENLCKGIMSNQYNYRQLGGNSILKDMDIYNMIDFTNIDFQNQKIENIELINELNNQILNQQNIIETLKNQLEQTMIYANKDLSLEEISNANIINNTDKEELNVFAGDSMSMESIPEPPKKAKVSIDPFGNIIEETNNKDNSSSKETFKTNIATNPQPVSQGKPKKWTVETTSMIGDILGKEKNISDNKRNNFPKYQQEQRNQNPTLTIENVNDYMEAMTPIMWDILEVIGTTGCSTSNEVLEIINKDVEKYTKSLVLNSIASLNKMTILTSDNISTGYRRFKVIKLSNKGELMYKNHFNKEPNESEADKISRDHDNIIHGYTIKDARDLLLSVHKCKSAIMERQEVSIKLPNNKTYIPDIIAVKENNERMYMEVELGNTPQNDFNEKCNKMIQVTKNLYFITDTEETIKKKLEQQVSIWILNQGGKEKVVGTVIYITTMTQLAKGEWSRIYKY